MIILDTNVISETQKPEPDQQVMAWIDSLDISSTYLTSVTVAELFYGVNVMPIGKRKNKLQNAVTSLVEKTFSGRVLGFDAAAAFHFGTLVAGAKQTGQTVSFADGAIAAIARANNNAIIATRDVPPFSAMQVDFINPWEI